MQLRSARERAIQTLCYELGGFLLVSPFYSLAVGASIAESATLMVALSAAMFLWTPLHNTAFDWAEIRLARRSASDRPHGWRVVHAFSHEGGSALVTVPIVMYLGGFGFWAALAVDFGLTVAYVGYAYFFHLGFDRLRPVTPRTAPAVAPVMIRAARPA